MLKFEIRLLLEVGNMISTVSLFTVDDNGVTVLFHRIALLDGGYFFSSERIDAVHLLTCIVSDYAMNIVPVHPANSVPVLFEIDRHNALPSLSRLLLALCLSILSSNPAYMTTGFFEFISSFLELSKEWLLSGGIISIWGFIGRRRSGGL